MNILQHVNVESIYPLNSADKQLMPKRMAWATPDTRYAIQKLAQRVKNAGGNLRLSDLFRSYADQKAANLKQPKLSPPPGRSNHEAGRAFDIDLDAINMSLEQFWKLASGFGVTPIIASPDRRANEAWHFECLGSHITLRKLGARYVAMSGILDLGLPVDEFPGEKRRAAHMQCMLHRINQDPGAIDGIIGPKTNAALAKATEGYEDYPIDPYYLLQGLCFDWFPNEFGWIDTTNFVRLA